MRSSNLLTDDAEPGSLSGFIDFHWRDPIDDPKHRVKKRTPRCRHKLAQTELRFLVCRREQRLSFGAVLTKDHKR